MAIPLDITDFIRKAEKLPIIDVRSPEEFARGHMKGAHNIPLFSNEERAEVGTIYKQEGKEKAIDVGLRHVGPKLEDIVAKAREVAPDKQVLVHCWRGGMRSSSVAWLLETSGFDEVQMLSGGYKAYRKHVQRVIGEPWNLLVLGGRTGSGKTDILKEMELAGQQVIDLEGLANHKGSAFGGIGLAEQPTVEEFENELFNKLDSFDPVAPIWVENESQSIGKVVVPREFHDQMKDAFTLYIDRPVNVRVERLVREYASQDRAQLQLALDAISKRLGGLNYKMATSALAEGDYKLVAEIALKYYDTAYQRCLNERNENYVSRLDLKADEPKANAQAVIAAMSDRMMAHEHDNERANKANPV